MSFTELAKKRYSVRNFDSAPVTREQTDAILEAGRIAPTARNNQPVRVKVFSTPDEFAAVDTFTRCRFGAQLVLLTAYDKSVAANSEFALSGYTGEIDCGIVQTHMMFQAEELGLGTLWVMRFDSALASKTLNLPENIVPMSLLMVGKPSDNSAPSERHNDRNPIADMLL